MRPSAASGPTEAGTTFADDVAYYLAQTPRQLPSRYLYDELGSSLFEAICRLPWYHITRTEQRLLRAHADEIFGRLRSVASVVELGPGSGEKLATLMAARPEHAVTVHLVDVSSAALCKAAAALTASPSLSIVEVKETIPAPPGGRERQRNVLDRFAIIAPPKSSDLKPTAVIQALRRHITRSHLQKRYAGASGLTLSDDSFQKPGGNTLPLEFRPDGHIVYVEFAGHQTRDNKAGDRGLAAGTRRGFSGVKRVAGDEHDHVVA
jgi:hypothetical protein